MSTSDLLQRDEKRVHAASAAAPSPSLEEPSDRLTIRRLLILTAGVAVGLALFAPHFSAGDLADAGQWRAVVNAVIIGLALPAPLFCIPRAFRNRGLGAGGLFALAVGLGVWLLLPAAVVEWLARNASPSNQRNMTGACLYNVLPLMGFWYLLAALTAGHAGRRLYSRTTPWTERYGFFLSLLWSPLGVWLLVDIYRDVLHV
jgi:hypothetical protein